jgi:hypothetical protein
MARPRRPRGRRLADGSIRDTNWQREEYARQMGEERAHEQEVAYRREQGLCTCKNLHGVTIKTRGTFRTIHEEQCPKWKPWMEEYKNISGPGRRWWGEGEQT